MKDAEFRAFIQGERRKLIHYVRSLVKETAEMEAEDVVHDVMTKILERPRSSLPFDITAYVYRAVKNRVIDLIRVRKPTVSLYAGDGDAVGPAATLVDVRPNALELLQTEEGKRQLFEALESLSAIERRVVIAHEFEGVGFRDLSVQMGIPLNTLLSHKSRAMRKLKQHFLNSK